jgi:glutamate-ammonia-ligase adenylyltransferase
LAEGSDLDIMVVYDAPEGAGADYYARLTQRLISALAAPTAEGVLYEIDAKLRPSGSKGPVAVRLSAFERYYEQEAWTWELQALTRLRAAAGDPGLGARAEAIAQAALLRARDRAATCAEVAKMRARMERERAAKDFWDLKLSPGGFVDVEFIAQALQLTCANAKALSTNTGLALANLRDIGALSGADWSCLDAGWRLWSDLHQVGRLALGAASWAEAPQPLAARMAALAGQKSLAGLKEIVCERRIEVREAFERIVAPLGDGSEGLRR